MCTSVCGVKLWDNFRCSATIIKFKKMFTDQMIEQYELDNIRVEFFCHLLCVCVVRVVKSIGKPYVVDHLFYLFF